MVGLIVSNWPSACRRRRRATAGARAAKHADGRHDGARHSWLLHRRHLGLPALRAEGSVQLMWIPGAIIGAVIVMLFFIAFGVRLNQKSAAWLAAGTGAPGVLSMTVQN